MTLDNNKKSLLILPLIVLILGIALIVSVVMQIVPWAQQLLPDWPHAVLNVALLSIAISPLVYFVIRKDVNSIATDKAQLTRQDHYKLNL